MYYISVDSTVRLFLRGRDWVEAFGGAGVLRAEKLKLPNLG